MKGNETEDPIRSGLKMFELADDFVYISYIVKCHRYLTQFLKTDSKKCVFPNSFLVAILNPIFLP